MHLNELELFSHKPQLCCTSKVSRALTSQPVDNRQTYPFSLGVVSCVSVAARKIATLGKTGACLGCLRVLPPPIAEDGTPIGIVRSKSERVIPASSAGLQADIGAQKQADMHPPAQPPFLEDMTRQSICAGIPSGGEMVSSTRGEVVVANTCGKLCSM